MSHFRRMMTGLWIRHLSLVSPKHLAHLKIYSHTPFRKVILGTGYLHSGLRHVYLLRLRHLFNGTTILLFYWGNFQTDVGIHEINVKNQGTVRTKQLPLAKRYEMGHL